ncbi:lipoprotein-anchoring transpeptidase ErfK/SrfK [Saccharothrix coeruleofusca]|uniref:L,D-transpeptidase n=1 Tax=Saccharothrix coeruleofusca TaxID=33919 RepID=UPI001AE3B7F8|nr:L,D-transpeptidase [Saccharothrix coeruleofusca]MBP2340850.1 lipoprotein-anchoring transpeptidase ErfK/SrfK [Saccharothrix coeruleofusca]
MKTLSTAAIAALALGFGFAAPASAATGTPCSIRDGACVRLSTNQAWLVYRGEASYGPVPVAHGRPGYETPTGTFPVLRKVRNDWSRPYNAPMPHAVYFTTDGIAFHEGGLTEQSHGCVRLSNEAAATFYANLFPGEQVQVVR